jgi:hypothetical protein
MRLLLRRVKVPLAIDGLARTFGSILGIRPVSGSMPATTIVPRRNQTRSCPSNTY